MKQLIKIAEKIKNKKLREKTIKLLKDQKISDSEIKYPKANFEKAPAWVGAHHDYEGGLLIHTASVARIAIRLSEALERIHKIKVNLDFVISGALLHDIMKVFVLKKYKKSWKFTGALIDHAVFSACELYARDFPEEVVHIVAAHGGDIGMLGANPKTTEAAIVFNADVLDSSTESAIDLDKVSDEELLQNMPIQLMLMQEGKEL